MMCGSTRIELLLSSRLFIVVEVGTIPGAPYRRRARAAAFPATHLANDMHTREVMKRCWLGGTGSGFDSATRRDLPRDAPAGDNPARQLNS